MSSYKIKNPSAGNDYFDTSASAISDSVQPSLNRGRVIGGANSTLSVGLTKVDAGARLAGNPGRTVFGTKVIVSARQGVQSADFSGNTSLTSAAGVNGLTDYTKNSHGLVVGDVIIVADTNGKLSGPQRVIGVPDANSIITDKPFNTGAGTLTYGVVDGTFAIMTPEKYVMRKVTTELHGVANTTLLSGASDYGMRRSIHKVETAFRHDGVAAAIRAGYWNEYSASFTTAPTPTNNSVGNVAGSTVTNGTADHAATPTRAIPGELVYRKSGAPSAGTSASDGIQLDDYEARTLG